MCRQFRVPRAADVHGSRTASECVACASHVPPLGLTEFLSLARVDAVVVMSVSFRSKVPVVDRSSGGPPSFRLAAGCDLAWLAEVLDEGLDHVDRRREDDRRRLRAAELEQRLQVAELPSLSRKRGCQASETSRPIGKTAAYGRSSAAAAAAVSACTHPTRSQRLPAASCNQATASSGSATSAGTRVSKTTTATGFTYALSEAK